jgi:hypothetical protein
MKHSSLGRLGRIIHVCGPRALLVSLLASPLLAQPPAAAPSRAPAATAPSVAPKPKPMGSVLFIGNSFLFGSGSAVRFHRAQTVTDLNGTGFGGVPALFKTFATQAGLDFTVSHETVSGTGFEHHVEKKADLIGRAWDRVAMVSHSLLNREQPGNPDLLIRSAKQLAELLHSKNPAVDIRLISTWSRADQVYPATGHWHGKPIEQMAKDVRAAYDRAAATTPFIRGVVPVGEAWNRAFKAGVADPNPYDGVAYGQVDLWAHDQWHASTYGYYLEALVIFGDLTGLDPRSLDKDERSAWELGLSPAQATALQQVAFDELSAQKPNRKLEPFTAISLGKKG